MYAPDTVLFPLLLPQNCTRFSSPLAPVALSIISSPFLSLCNATSPRLSLFHSPRPSLSRHFTLSKSMQLRIRPRSSNALIYKQNQVTHSVSGTSTCRGQTRRGCRFHGTDSVLERFSAVCRLCNSCVRRFYERGRRTCTQVDMDTLKRACDPPAVRILLGFVDTSNVEIFRWKQ